MNKNGYTIIVLLLLFSNFFNTIQTRGRNFHRDAWASFLDYTGHHDKAQRWYEQILAGGGSWYSFKGYINVLEKKKKYSEIVSLINKEIEVVNSDTQKTKKTLDNLFSNDPEIQFIFAQALGHIGKSSEAQNRFIRLSQTFKKSPEIMLHAIEAYIQKQQPDKAIETIDLFLNNTPKKPTHFVFYFLKAQLLTQLQQYKEAHRWAKKCVKPNPNFAQGWLLKAIIEEQLGMNKEAIGSYHNFLKTSGIYNSQILKHLIDLEEKTKKQSRKKQNNKPILDELSSFLNNSNDPCFIDKFNSYLDQLTFKLPLLSSQPLKTCPVVRAHKKIVHRKK